jgi:hypothetical protein
MTRRTLKRLGLLAAVCLLVGVLAALLLRPGLPSYNGQSLAFWFKNLPNVSVPAPETLVTYKLSVFGGPLGPPEPGEKNAREALVAIRAMGTNALPFLISKLKRPDPHPAFDNLVRSYSGKLPVIQRLLPTTHQVFVERQQAVTGLVALCPLPSDTVLELRKLSLDFQGPNWSLAGDILRANDNPRLCDAALRSYFQDLATMEELRRGAISGRFNNRSGLLARPELHDTATRTSIGEGVRLELSPGRGSIKQ